ncbi:MAG: tryptophan--tRNA ligase [Clostridia bacterium]|nr:tryptophan--tRNA ligase [Clostridia bacterium]MBR5991438.1 tryptophan--tRNA ligase [Clostridia bacterium]MBR6512029.1 tryptophan--tRNA ligase [Clostridia bacterium]
MEEQVKKKKVLSLIQPSGTPTLGNYLGALKNWSDIAEEYDCAFGVADLHAITVRQDPVKFREQIRNMYALMIAIGLDPEKSILFVQSQVPTHAQLAWILDCYTQFGEMSRMTQFKDKSKTHADNVNVGLFAYPALMAADILLYQADYVPVGADQKQHLEIARDIADRFNGIYGQTFTSPEPLFVKEGAKVMSLADPTKKMSKSDANPKAFISMLDTPDAIMKKFKSAVTDSEAEVRYAEGKDGVNNLMSIYSACTGKSYDEIEKEFAGKGYGDFKVAVAEAAIEELRPVQEKFNKLINERAYLEDCMKNGSETATRISQRTLDKAMKKIGFYQFKD